MSTELCDIHTACCVVGCPDFELLAMVPRNESVCMLIAPFASQSFDQRLVVCSETTEHLLSAHFGSPSSPQRRDDASLVGLLTLHSHKSPAARLGVKHTKNTRHVHVCNTTACTKQLYIESRVEERQPRIRRDRARRGSTIRV